jgi:hypothetical protein
VHPLLFPREEVEAVPSRTKDRRAHRIILHRGTGMGSPALLLGLLAGAQEHRDQRGSVAQVGAAETHSCRPSLPHPHAPRHRSARTRRALCSLGSGQRERTAVTGNEDLLTTGGWREGRGTVRARTRRNLSLTSCSCSCAASQPSARSYGHRPPGPIADNSLRGRAKAESVRHGHAPCGRWSTVKRDDTPERMEDRASPRTHTRCAPRS